MITGNQAQNLAVAIVALDEENAIARTIESAARLAGAIHVLDCGSRDDTAEVAARHGAHVHPHAWRNSFAEARNALLAKIEQPWVLWLDAGEAVGPETQALLSSFLAAEADRKRVYSMLIEAPPALVDGSPEQVVQQRLMPNVAGLKFFGRVAESVLPVLPKLGLQRDTAPGRIVRDGRCHDPQWKARRAQRNLHLASLEAPNPDQRSPRMWLVTGEALADLGHTSAACEAFRKTLAVAPKGSTEMLEAYYGLLAALDSDPARREERISVCLEALEAFPLDAQLLCAMGTYLQAANRADLAVRSFELAVTYGQVNLETWHVQEIAEMAAVCWALALQLAGDQEKAGHVLADALARFPESPRVRRRVVEHWIRTGQTEAALKTAAPLAEQGEAQDALLDAVAGACAAVRQNWNEALARLQSAYVGGCRHPICLRWLSVALLSLGETRSVEPILRQWIAADPQSPEPKTYLQAITGRAPDADTATVSTVDTGTGDKQRSGVEPTDASASSPDGTVFRHDAASQLADSDVYSTSADTGDTRYAHTEQTESLGELPAVETDGAGRFFRVDWPNTPRQTGKTPPSSDREDSPTTPPGYHGEAESD